MNNDPRDPKVPLSSPGYNPEKAKHLLAEFNARYPNVKRWRDSMIKKDWYCKRRIGRFEAAFSWRSKSGFWGRFGGGWNWKLGFQAGEGTIIFSLVVCEISFSWITK